MAKMPRQAPRPRPPRACRRCAARKVSCDKQRPTCSRCANVGLECQYATPGQSAGGEMTIIDETPSVVSLHGRLVRLSQMMADEEQSSQSSDPVDPQNGVDPGYLLRDPETKDRYFSSTFFAAISQEISDIEKIAREQKAEQETDSHHGHFYGDLFPNIPLWAEGDTEAMSQASVEDTIQSLPSLQQCEVFIWAYMAGYHTMKPIIHAPTFLREARRFATWREEADPAYHLNLHWLALYTAVIFAGTVVCPRARLRELDGDQTTRETLSARLYNLSIRTIRLSNFPQNPSLYSFSAFIIIDSTWLREEQPLTCSSFIGVAFRVAQILGLHREPSKFPGIEQLEIETRRRLWWTVVALDAQVAFASSLPPLIEPKLYPVELVVQQNESDALKMTPKTASKSILGIFSQAKFMFYREASTLLHLLSRYDLSKNDVDTVLQMITQIRAEIESHKAQILTLEQLASAQPGDGDPGFLQQIESNKALARFTWTVLSMLADKPYAILYGPFRKHGYLEYLRAREPDAISSHCRNFLHRFLILTQCRDFQLWHWCWPGQHQPLHSMMALIMELDDFPDAPLANETRKLVDLALRMCRTFVNGGIQSDEDGEPDVRHLGGGGEAWRSIRRARDRVWKKVGMDPNVLVCPENAEDINFEAYSGIGDNMNVSNDSYDSDWLFQSATDWAFLDDVGAELWAPTGSIDPTSHFDGL